MSADQKKIVIIGAGFAGAACAWWLAQKGAKDIVVLEQEEMPGVHSSGLNAGLARRFEEDPHVAPLASEGVDFILNPPKGFCDTKLIERNGSLMLNPPLIPPFRHTTGGQVKKGGVGGFFQVLKKEEAIQKVPVLADAKFDSALWTLDDGIIDIHSYLWAFINGAKKRGVKFNTDCRITGFGFGSCPIHRAKCLPDKSGNYIHKIVTTKGEFSADCVVNATGGWAQAIGNMAGAEDLQIKPFRRHLYCTPVMKEVDPKWPFVWDMAQQYYFRPESGGLLLGACDEEEVAPGVPQMNPKIKEVLADKLSKYCPALSNVSIAREWCGLRTFTPDRRPVIRWDEKVKNFFWLAALGGRGVTCAASAGRMAAEKVIKCVSI